MRFPFFSLRRKGDAGTQKRKFGRICCFHVQASSKGTPLFGQSNVTAIVHETSSDDQGVSEHRILNEGESSRTSSYSETNDQTVRSSAVHTAQSNTGTESESTSRINDASPMMNVPRRRQPGKGPGLGAVDDEPPSRMPQEHQEHDLSSLLHPTRRNSNGAHAPQLPTRLEVCVDRHRQQPFLPLLADSAVSMTSDRSIGSHPLTDSSPSPLADSVAPRRRSSPDAPRRSESSRGTSIRSLSPSAFNATSARQEDVATQPTRQSAQDVWRFETTSSLRDAPRLSGWHVRLKLDWVSENSNDVVAEVCLDSSSSPASVTSASAERARQTVCEIAEEEDDSLSASQDLLMSHHTSVVDIVDHVLAELQREKRTRRHHVGTESSKTTRHLRPSIEEEEDDDIFETEFYRARCSSTARIRRRLEILQAFEVLIEKKQQLITTPDGTEYLTDGTSKRMLTEAVFHDLKLEIARLGAELENRRSCSDDGWGTQHAIRSSISRFQYDTNDDGDSSQEASSKGKRTQSAPATSSYAQEYADMLSMQRSASCYSELQPATLSRLVDGQNQRNDIRERCTRMASLDEESLFAKVSDVASSTAS